MDGNSLRINSTLYKMNIKIIIIYISLFIIMISCNYNHNKSNKLQNHLDEKVEVFINWPATIHLNSIPLVELSEKLFFPTSINAVGNYLVFVEDADSAKIKIFSLEDYSYLNSFGRLGQGPNEFAAISGVIQDEPKNSPYLTIYDWGKKAIFKYSVEGLIADNSKASPVKTYVLPPQLIETHQVLFSPIDSKIIGFAGMDIGKLYSYDMLSDSVEQVTPFIPTIDYNPDKYKLGKLYRGSIAVNPNREKLVAASRLFKQLEIYDYELNLIASTRWGETIDVITRGPNQRMEIRTSSDSKLNYTDLDFNDDRIFLLFENRTLNEMNNGTCHDSRIHAYDWEGRPREQYMLEDCPNFISFDHINKRFIGIFLFTDSDDENELIRYYQL